MTRVVLFPTCVVDTVSPEVGAAVVAVLRRTGFEVEVPADVTCCGQPAWNAGYATEAAAVAATTLQALADDDAPVCVPAGSCATMMRVYWPTLFETVGDDPSAEAAAMLADRVREFSELIAEASTGAGAGDAVPPAGTTAYHHSCHMLRELGIEDEPEELLRGVGIEPSPWPGAYRCCGFGGTFAVKQPEISVAMADDKLDDLEHIDRLVGCDTSCLLHLRGRAQRRGLELEVRHLAEVLADEGAGE